MRLGIYAIGLIVVLRSLMVPSVFVPVGAKSSELQLITPVKTSEAKWGRVPRVYIECLRDRALTPPFQKRLYTAVPCQQVISMDTSHSPFFSAPGELVRHLTAL